MSNHNFYRCKEYLSNGIVIIRMKNKFQKMNKNDLYFAVIEECKKKGIEFKDVDQKQSYLDNNTYQLISKDKHLLLRIDLFQLFNEEPNSNGKFGIGCFLLPFIILTFVGGWFFIQIWTYGFLGLIRNQEKRYSCEESKEYKELYSEKDKHLYIKKCMNK
jgi:hypothetical protein